MSSYVRRFGMVERIIFTCPLGHETRYPRGQFILCRAIVNSDGIPRQCRRRAYPKNEREEGR